MTKSKPSTFKHTVWKSCALYVKLRECDNLGNVRCCTCNKLMHYKDSDAGHFVPGRGNEVLFDDAHIFPQCQGCNFDGGGEQYKYGLFLKKKYGYTDQIIDEIINKRHKVKKFSLSELKEIKISFDLEIKRLKEKKGIK